MLSLAAFPDVGLDSFVTIKVLAWGREEMTVLALSRRDSFSWPW